MGKQMHNQDAETLQAKTDELTTDKRRDKDLCTHTRERN